MAGVATGESGPGSSFEGASSGQNQLQCQSGEALNEWRSSEQVENGTPSTSPPYWDIDDDEDGGPKPSELYGKYTWKIDKFSQTNKRELRSNAFEVGGYKWYILIYPQGCDVCNHLSLFLCVANHDKLLPGWSHFAQFTIAVVNKDPKKSKYSDTLHRFWKKEHDWGWKKFMELAKVMDGFIDADTLIIKAQVQVIRERADRPFRCLDCQYRRELVRVYLTNVEQICRRFVEERRTKLGKLIEDKARWSSFCTFWLGMEQSSKRRMSREKTESILKVLVRHFFVDKEVTSTLVMDSLYSGLKCLEGQNKGKDSKVKHLEAEELPVPVIRIEKDTFVLVDDVLLLLERVSMEPLPPKDDKGPQNRTKDVAAGEEFSKDSIERDERRLTDLGRRTIEIFVLAHIFSKIEVSYQEAVALKRQEELIREEEAAWLAEIEQKPRRGAADKEKKAKKKRGKQKKNNRKGKDKGKDEKLSSIVQDDIDQDNPSADIKNFLGGDSEMLNEKLDAAEDASDASDSVDCAAEILPLDVENRDATLVNWDNDDTFELQPPTEASSSGISSLSGGQNEIDGKSPSLVDDSSSTCSSDSVPSAVTSVAHRGNIRHHKSQYSAMRGRDHQSKVVSDDLVCEQLRQPSKAIANPRHSVDASRSYGTAETMSQVDGRSFQDRVVNGTERRVKEEETGPIHRNSSAKVVDVEVPGNGAASVSPPPVSPSKGIPSIPASKTISKVTASSNSTMVKRSSLAGPELAERLVPVANSAESSTIVLETDSRNPTTLKKTEKPSANQVQMESDKSPHHVPVTADKLTTTPPMPRPLSAPLVPGPRPVVSMVSTVQSAPILSRSISAAGRLGPEPSVSSSQSVPQSYRNAIIGGHVTGNSSAYAHNHAASSVVNTSLSYSQATNLPMFPPHNSDRMDPTRPGFSFGMANRRDIMQNGPRWTNGPISDGNSRNINMDQTTLLNDMQSLNLYNNRLQEDHLPSEFPAAGTSGRHNYTMTEEFPHLDIINDLLDDEIVYGNANISSSVYPNNYHLNRQFSFPGDPGMSSGLGPTSRSCRFERTQSYQDDNFLHGRYGASGSFYDTAGNMIPQAPPSRPYMNGQVDGSMHSQWQVPPSSDLSYMNLMNPDNDVYAYHNIPPEYTNLTVGINGGGYTVFRPTNGH